MDDMNAFERQVANEVTGSVRPPRPVDTTAIVREATTQSPKWRFQSMFNATKFAVAAAIVALFGGFLLAGVLTTRDGDEQVIAPAASPSAEPSQEADLLPSVELDTIEVGPGVFHVLGDGVHDLTSFGEAARDEPGLERPESGEVVVTPGGEVWVITQPEIPWTTGVPAEWENKVIRLGDPEIALEGSGGPWSLFVTADGSPLVVIPTDDGSRASVLRAGTWTSYPEPGSADPCSGLHLRSDRLVVADECWMNGLDRGGVHRSRLVADSRSSPEYLPATAFGLPEDLSVEWLHAEDDGTGWASVSDEDRLFRGLVRYDSESWTYVPYEPTEGLNVANGESPILSGAYPSVLAVDPDGSVWVGFGGNHDESPSLTVGRWDGELWRTYGPVRVDWDYQGGETHFLADGSIWFLDGLAVFDGDELRRLDLPIRGQLVSDPEGDVLWTTIGGRLYAITPEAAAAE